MPLVPRIVASEWLARYAAAVSGDNIHAAVELLLPDGWLRDVLVFTWDIRALEGREKVASYLVNTMTKARITDVRLNETADLAPRIFLWPELQVIGVELAFTFECRHGHGQGYARLLPDAEGAFRAYTLLTELADLVGHEEFPTLRFRDDLAGDVKSKGPPTMRELQNAFAKWKDGVEKDPHVLIGKATLFRCCLRRCLADRSVTKLGQARLVSRLRRASSRWTFRLS